MNTIEHLLSTKNNQAILAIDTSCDDTSAAVVVGGVVHSNIIASQTQLHKPYGGVFPTVAKQAHKENIDRVVALALRRAGHKWSDIHAVAVTTGPGLAPALEVGIAKAKELAIKHELPLIAVNHLRGHALSVLASGRRRGERRQGDSVQSPVGAGQADSNKQADSPAHQPPTLALIISGGHSEFVLISTNPSDQTLHYNKIGQTLDDAAGECLDKIGRMLNLGYPAGATIEQFAKRGNPNAIAFPLPLTHRGDYDLSFSGIKTFARNTIEELAAQKPLDKQGIYDFCASAQYAVFRHICYKLNKIIEQTEISQVWLGGGVAANIELRRMIRKTIAEAHKKQRGRAGALNPKSARLKTPYSKRLCMDNAAMIGVAAQFASADNTHSTAAAIATIERAPRLSSTS